MDTATLFRSGKKSSLIVPQFLQAAVLVTPTLLLISASLRAPEAVSLFLALGAAFQILMGTLGWISRRGWNYPFGPSVITFYLIGLCWLWMGTHSSADWFIHFARAVLMIAPALAFGVGMLTSSGAVALRRAQQLAQRLASRKHLPVELAACRSLPEVKAFREALQVDAAPALLLLQHPRIEVRIAALCALEFRQHWRAGQAELILRVAQTSLEAPVRAAAVSALGNIESQSLVENLAIFLRDPAWEVRRAATEALLWDTERRWLWIRHAVRRTLADQAFEEDGALQQNGQLLCPEAVADLTAWAAEKGLVSIRAALTLGAHYTRHLNERPEDNIVPELRQTLANPQTPPALRLELARILQQNAELDKPVLEKLLLPVNPAPLRLLAVESLLAHGDHPEAVSALHDLARLPNRELALTTAQVIQRRLGVDMGLDLSKELPALHSRQAAEITRRVMQWAAQHDVPENVADSRPLAKMGEVQ